MDELTHLVHFVQNGVFALPQVPKERVGLVLHHKLLQQGGVHFVLQTCTHHEKEVVHAQLVVLQFCDQFAVLNRVLSYILWDGQLLQSHLNRI